ncbi:AraC family transcriptional regulator [Bdellovibrio bacteriovorus]|uniref:helix-turn-helix domain-containing protein n=1 Tax=Bdellovibrio bacteriovorus TaxID=959 RepID=UPI0021D25004|nr:AraC family transcriptional regulator [Bdellovibrio bacteriovorus]UXR64689.1 AraC family transcriptional regulator [Bdellovibrio bacteriovorus]
MLRQLGMVGSQASRVRAAISNIVTNYARKIDIETLSSDVGMSPSSFHKYFKDVTAMSPIQFQKNLRLMEARRMLMSESGDAASIAFKVGYESPSQFSREYARFFGAPPKADRERMKKNFETSLKRKVKRAV